MPFLGDLNLFNGEQNPARNLLSVAVLLFFFGPYTLLAAADPNGTKLNPILYVCIYIQASATEM